MLVLWKDGALSTTESRTNKSPTSKGPPTFSLRLPAALRRRGRPRDPEEKLPAWTTFALADRALHVGEGEPFRDEVSFLTKPSSRGEEVPTTPSRAMTSSLYLVHDFGVARPPSAHAQDLDHQDQDEEQLASVSIGPLRRTSLVISNLQKAVRRGAAGAAVASAAYLIHTHQEVDLLRRLVVIWAEDVAGTTAASMWLGRLVWLMVAASSFRYRLTDEDALFVLAFVARTAGFHDQHPTSALSDVLARPEAVGGKARGDREKPKKAADLVGMIARGDVRAIKDGFSPLRLALFLRACYGGMQCDVEMLLDLIDQDNLSDKNCSSTTKILTPASPGREDDLLLGEVLAALKGADVFVKLLEAPSPVAAPPPPVGADNERDHDTGAGSAISTRRPLLDIPDEYRLPEAVDFHCSNIVEDVLLHNSKLGLVPALDVAAGKRLIWECRSSVNIRNHDVDLQKKWTSCSSSTTSRTTTLALEGSNIIRAGYHRPDVEGPNDPSHDGAHAIFKTSRPEEDRMRAIVEGIIAPFAALGNKARDRGKRRGLAVAESRSTESWLLQNLNGTPGVEFGRTRPGVDSSNTSVNVNCHLDAYGRREWARLTQTVTVKNPRPQLCKQGAAAGEANKSGAAFALRKKVAAGASCTVAKSAASGSASGSQLVQPSVLSFFGRKKPEHQAATCAPAAGGATSELLKRDAPEEGAEGKVDSNTCSENNQNGEPSAKHRKKSEREVIVLTDSEDCE